MTYRLMELREVGKPLVMATRPLKDPELGQVRIRLIAAGVNRRDYWIWKGQYANMALPAVLGSDGCGRVEAIGEGVSKSLLGMRVVVNPSLNWGKDESAPAKTWRILGMPDEGTFSECLTVQADQVYGAPEHLEDREAAVMPLAALTGYRALFSRGRLKAGERILITGAGGGVSQWMLAMAKSAGAAIWVTTGQQERLDRALLDGVKGGVLYRQAGWAQELAKQCPEGFDLIIDSAGGPGFSDLIETLKPGGRLVFFGATQGNVPELPIRKFYWRQLEMLGTTMGSPQDFENMLKFVTQHQLRPTLDSFIGIQDATSAMHRMEQGESFGKIAIQIKFD